MKYLLIALMVFSSASFAEHYELGDQLDSGYDSYTRDSNTTDALNRIDEDLRQLNSTSDDE